MLENIVEFGICFIIGLTYVYIMESEKSVNHEIKNRQTSI